MLPLSYPASAPLDLGEAEVFLANWELAAVSGRALLPAGLIPTSPTLVTVLAWRAGGCCVVHVRLSCRSGPRARALHVATWVDAPPELRATLASGWGLVGEAAPIRLKRSYHETDVAVGPDGSILSVGLADPRPIQGTDIQYVVGLHPVSLERGARLVQMDLDFEPARAERGTPVLHTWSPGPALDPRIKPAHPVSATVAVGSLHLPRPRYLLDPTRAAHVGTESIG